jgi:D-alanyl-D-alanine carboxypeptidase
VYLPEKQTTLVILLNTDIAYQGSEPSTTLTTAITQIISPEHIYSLSPAVPEPDLTPRPHQPSPGDSGYPR